MTKALSIGFDAKRAFVNAAGLGNYSRNTLRALGNVFPNNHYFLFTPKIVNNRFSLPQGSTVIMPNSFWWRALKPFWRRYKISGLAQKAKLDLYHGLSHELPIGIEKTSTKSIVTIHDLIFIRYPELYKRTDRKIYFKKYLHACKVADHIIAISEQSKHDIMDYFGIDQKKISVIYQSVNPIFFEENDQAKIEKTRKKYQLPSKFILSVGTIEARKNLKLVLQALNEMELDCPLVVVGKPTKYMDTIKPLIHKLGDRLILLHQVKDDDLNQMYRMARLMIYASVFEGFGLPIAEAQAAGCPVITSKVSSMPEAGGKAAHYISPNSISDISKGIKKIVDDDSYRVELIEKGFENSKRFSPDNYAEQLMTIYQKVYDER